MRIISEAFKPRKITYIKITFYRNDSGEVDRMVVVGVFETPLELEKIP